MEIDKSIREHNSILKLMFTNGLIFLHDNLLESWRSISPIVNIRSDRKKRQIVRNFEISTSMKTTKIKTEITPKMHEQ